MESLAYLEVLLVCPCGFSSEGLSWIMDVGFFVSGISVLYFVGSSASRRSLLYISN